MFKFSMDIFCGIKIIVYVKRSLNSIETPFYNFWDVKHYAVTSILPPIPGMFAAFGIELSSADI